MILVQNLSKNYGDKRAIANVSFQIESGEIVGLLGLNGAGKSTILKILGTFLMPSEGYASIGGIALDEDPQAIRSMIGYMPDVAPLYTEMTVLGFLTFVARIKDVEASKVRSYVDDAINATNLGTVADATIQSLSHGFRQRVGIAQSIVHKPQVLIFDEPINGLDPVQIVEMRDLILSFKKKHTVILSSHILSEITKTCDRILIVDQGKLVAEGNEESLRRSVREHFVISVEVQKAPMDLAGRLEKLNGVIRVDAPAKSAVDGNMHLRIELAQNARSLVARTIMESGAELLALVPESAGLENLFLKFVGGKHNV